MNFHVKKFVEQEIRDYHQTKQMLAEAVSEFAEEDIFAPSTNCAMDVKTAGLAKHPERKTMRRSCLRSTRWLREAERRLEAMEKAFNRMGDEQRQLLQLKYWCKAKPLSMEGLALMMNVDESTVRRWNKNIVTLVAMEMGLL